MANLQMGVKAALHSETLQLGAGDSLSSWSPNVSGAHRWPWSKVAVLGQMSGTAGADGGSYRRVLESFTPIFFIPKASKSGLQLPPALCTQLTLAAVPSRCRGVAIFGGKRSFLQPFPKEGRLSWCLLFATGCSRPGSLTGVHSRGSNQPSLAGGGLGEGHPDGPGPGRSFVLCPGAPSDPLTRGLQRAGRGGGCLSLPGGFSLSFNPLACQDESLIAGAICTAWPAVWATWGGEG